MARVRCLERCYANHRVYEAGAEFDYTGPEQKYLQLIAGEWTKRQPKNAVQATLEAENAELRRKLEAAEAAAVTKPGKALKPSSAP